MIKENIGHQELFAERRARLMEVGRISLSKINIDPKEYEVYFDLMRKADAPLGQVLGVFNYLDGVIITPSEALEVWESIKSIFDKIKLDEYDEISGRAH